MATRTATRPETIGEQTGVTLRDRFHPVTERAIRDLTDSGSFDRGRGYARGREIFDATLRGETLRASCHGQSGGPYRVEATLVPAEVVPPDGSPIAAVACSCPRGGFCKHIVALLLTWIEAPERFEVRPPVPELLAGKSREELIALVELLIRRDPDLADLIELTPPVAAPTGAVAPAEPGAGRIRTVSPATIARQVRRAFQVKGEEYGWDDYDAGSTVASQLADVRALGDGYAAAGRWADALVVYRTIVDKAASEETYVRDDEGDLFVEVSHAAAGLIACLAAQTELPPDERLTPEDRAGLIDALYDFWEYGEEYDVEEDADPVAALAAHATEEGKAAIERRLRARLDAKSEPAAAAWVASTSTTAANAIPIPNYTDLYRKRSTLSFLSELKGEALPQEELLSDYQRAELWPDAAWTLLELDRMDEAIGLAGRKLNPVNLLPFADRLIERDPALASRAFDLIEGWLREHEGANITHEQNLLNWLQARYAAHDRPNRALEAARRRFMKQPGFQTYEGVRTAAALPDREGPSWEEMRQILLAHLREQQDWGTLFDVSLHESAADQALATLNRHDAGRKRPAGGFNWGGWGESSWDDRRRRLAVALEASQPNEAIRLYTILGEDAIEGRNRTSYQTAARHLATAKNVYLAQGREPEWRVYIAALRETHKRLRALKEELDALDLR